MKEALRINCRMCGQAIHEEGIVISRTVENVQDFHTEQRPTPLEVVECPLCGLVQTDYPKEEVETIRSYPSEETNNSRRTLIERIFKAARLEPKKGIEIGSGNGDWLPILRNFCTVEGVKSVYDLKHNDYDLFFSFHHLEHYRDPSSAAFEIYNHTTSNAFGIITVPNYTKILNERLFTEFMPEHHCYFTPETLLRIFEFNGFKGTAFEYIDNEYSIAITVKKRSPTLKNVFREASEKLVSNITQVAKDKTYAIWGAGHQTIALMQYEIPAPAYVVDDDINKQGGHIPITNIPIVSSKHLEDTPVDFILVIAGSYTDQIVEKNKHRNLLVIKDNTLVSA